jgi:hypothetical protein
MSDMPFLTRQDEEFQMLLEVAEEYTRQQREKTTEKKSGDATEIVIRKHLLKRGFNVTLRPELKIQGSNKVVARIDSLLLKPRENSNEEKYTPEKVDMMIEIKNNGVAEQTTKIRRKFDEAREISENFRFAVIVLSERLLSRTPYKHAITEEKLENKKYRVFTLIARRIWDRMYEVPVANRMLENHELWKTGEWEKLQTYLRE